MNRKRFFFSIIVMVLISLPYFLIRKDFKLSSSLQTLLCTQSLPLTQSVSLTPTSFYQENNSISNLPASKTGIILAFDLHGVLLGVDAKRAFNEVGLSSVLKYASALNISFSQIEHELTKKVYGVFNTIQSTGNDCNALDPYGNRMPGLMCDWQRGLKSNSELKAIIEKAIEAHPEWFAADIEKQLVHQIMVKMFTPELLVSTVKIIPEGLDFVKKCKEQGHTLIILSNWDPESFQLLQAKFPEFLILFDGMIVSGITHEAKPKREAYGLLIDRQKKYHEDILFIDDQKENVDAARKYGLQAIVCTSKPNFLGFTSAPDFLPIEKQVALLMLKHKNKQVPTSAGRRTRRSRRLIKHS